MATVGIRGNVRPRSGAAAAGNAIPADTPTFADLAFADLTGAHPAVRPPQATGPAAQAEPPVHGLLPALSRRGGAPPWCARGRTLDHAFLGGDSQHATNCAREASLSWQLE